MTYHVKEIRYTLQGEGANTGRPAVLLRFAGCNLWTGREADRSAAVCRFCDTDFVGVDGPGGSSYSSSAAVADAVSSLWPSNETQLFVVCTGGEPLLQLDSSLIAEFKNREYYVALETNGTIAAPDGIDWICVSPKAGTRLEQISGDELKLVYPQDELAPVELEDLDFKHFFLQPMDGPHRGQNTKAAVEYCLQHPKWRLSLQVHKRLGIP